MKAIIKNGNIIVRNQIPKIWKRKDTPNQETHNYRSLSDAEHYEDGWRDVVEPTLTEHQRRGDLYFDETNDVFTYNVIDLTQEEIDQLNESNEENEAQEKLDSHVENGEDLFRRCYKKIWRRVNKDSEANNSLKNVEGNKLRRWFQPVYLWLKCGNWKEANKEIDHVLLARQVDLDLVPGMRNTADWLKSQIQSYLDNQYN